jgi:two-component system alkaline phosphatase synthesis response regulator PhoP
MDQLNTVNSVATLRILHIEDDETIATVAREMLEEQGWQINTCDDGNAAIEHISGPVHYDFLLVDYGLPGINGLELVRRARKLVHRSRTPVGILSANPVEAEAREVGADLFLRKPQDIGLLAESISRLLGERRQ